MCTVTICGVANVNPETLGYTDNCTRAACLIFILLIPGEVRHAFLRVKRSCLRPCHADTDTHRMYTRAQSRTVTQRELARGQGHKNARGSILLGCGAASTACRCQRARSTGNRRRPPCAARKGCTGCRTRQTPSETWPPWLFARETTRQGAVESCQPGCPSEHPKSGIAT